MKAARCHTDPRNKYFALLWEAMCLTSVSNVEGACRGGGRGIPDSYSRMTQAHAKPGKEEAQGAPQERRLCAKWMQTLNAAGGPG